MNINKSAVAKNRFVQAVQMTCGMVLVLFFSLALLGFFLEPALEDLYVAVVCVAFVTVGIWMIARSKHRGKLIKACSHYAFALEMVPAGVISELALATAREESRVRKDLNEMILWGLVTGVCLDEGSNRLLFTGSTESSPRFENKSAVNSGRFFQRLMTAVGTAIIVLFGVALCSAIPDPELASLVIPCSLLLAVGIMLILSAGKRGRLLDNCRRYALALEHVPDGSVAKLSGILAREEALVIQDLRQIISRRYLDCDFLDLERNRLRFVWERESDPQAAPDPAPEKPRKSGSTGVVCRRCGGVNKLDPCQDGICVYCGSRIRG